MQTLLERLLWLVEDQKARGVSQRQLSEKAGASPGWLNITIQRLKKGQRVDPGAQQLAQLAAVTDVSHSWLVEGKGEPRPGTRGDQGPASLLFLPAGTTPKLLPERLRIVVEHDLIPPAARAAIPQLLEVPLQRAMMLDEAGWIDEALRVVRVAEPMAPAYGDDFAARVRRIAPAVPKLAANDVETFIASYAAKGFEGNDEALRAQLEQFAVARRGSKVTERETLPPDVPTKPRRRR